MVIAMVHSLRGVVSSQMVRRGILCRTGPTPLAQGLLCTVGAVNVVAYDPWLAGLGHGHVEHPGVVLVAREVLGAAVGGTSLVCSRL